MFEINYLAVVVAAIVGFGLGALWYGPLFGRQWKALMGFTDESMRSMQMTPAKSMTLGALTTLVMAYVLAHFVSLAGATSVTAGMTLAFWLWLGFFATTQMGDVLWNNKPWKLYLLNASYYLVELLLMAGILGVWQ